MPTNSGPFGCGDGVQPPPSQLLNPMVGPGCCPDPSSECAACGLVILDKYFLQVVDRRWHSHCLRCSQCSVSLDAERSCFTRDGHIFCKEDYFKIFVCKRCSRCGQGIGSNDMVMKARDNVYHVSCFTCAWCDSTLSQGEYFGIIDNLVYCTSHFEMRSRTEDNGSMAIGAEAEEDASRRGLRGSKASKTKKPRAAAARKTRRCHGQKKTSSAPGAPGAATTTHAVGSPSAAGGQEQSELLDDSLTTNSRLELTENKGRGLLECATSSGSATSTTTTTAAAGVLVTPTPTPAAVRLTGPRAEDQDFGSSPRQRVFSDNNYAGLALQTTVAESGCSGGGGGGGLPSSSAASVSSMASSSASSGSFSPHRPKRMRTSFKHHQLRQMKAYFIINHNPDSKELKSLATKTQLSKRVLQVWFQNARAKWRRSVLRQQSAGPHVVEECQPLHELRHHHHKSMGSLLMLEPSDVESHEAMSRLGDGGACSLGHSPHHQGQQQQQQQTQQHLNLIRSPFENLSLLSENAPEGGVGLAQASRTQFFIGSNREQELLVDCSTRTTTTTTTTPTTTSRFGGVETSSDLDASSSDCCQRMVQSCSASVSPPSAPLTITQEEQNLSLFSYHFHQEQALY